MAHKYKTERDLIETCATILAERLKKQRNEQGLTLQFKQSEIDPLGSITFSGKISPLQRASVSRSRTRRRKIIFPPSRSRLTASVIFFPAFCGMKSPVCAHRVR